MSDPSIMTLQEQNPNMKLFVVPGLGESNTSFYEDDGQTMDYEAGMFAKTEFRLEDTGSCLRLTITPPADARGLLPEKRQMYLRFRDVEAEEIPVWVENQPVTLELKDYRILSAPSKEEQKNKILTRVQKSNHWKSRRLKAPYPAFVQDALAELEHL